MTLIPDVLALLFLVALVVSKRFRGLVARHLFGIAVALLGLAGVIVFTLVVTDFFSIDACLDSGGRWDKERRVCQHQEQPSAPQ